MKAMHDLSTLSWTLAGWTPYLWRMLKTLELGESPQAELRGIRAVVPGSVQQALRNANLLPDWKLPGNDRLCEWVENRHWVFETMLPDEWFASDGTRRLRCAGLDYSGWVLLNGKDVGTFRGTHVPHAFDLTPFAEPKCNRLQIVFDLPPRWRPPWEPARPASLALAAFCSGAVMIATRVRPTRVSSTSTVTPNRQPWR